MNYSFLSKALEAYYFKRGNRLFFFNGFSLNSLAWAMNEKLIGQIDPSVLSKILHGERLFSPRQIEIFTDVLGLDSYHKQWLHFNLYKDQCFHDDVVFDSHFLHPSDVFYYCEKIADQVHTSLYSGGSSQNQALIDYSLSLLQSQVLNDQEQKSEMIDLYSKVLYLSGRIISNVASAKNIQSQLHPILSQLHTLEIEHKNKNAFAYGNILKANGYYIQANYGTNPIIFEKSIQCAWNGYSNLPHVPSESLFALRTFLAISDYKKRNKTAFDTVSDILQKNPLDTCTDSKTRISLLHLKNTFVKVANNQCDSSLLSSFVFGEGCEEDNGIYDISNIRTQLELMKKMKIHDETTKKFLITRGLKISQEKGFSRHEKNILSFQ